MSVSEDFSKIKSFFIDRQNDFVIYKVTDKDSSLHSHYFTPPKYEDIFYLEFDAGYFNALDDKHYIDPYDSFVFGIQFVNYGDRIEVTDFNRSFECGVEEFEGNGLMAKYFDKVQKVARSHGFELKSLETCDTEIRKVTSISTFAIDAVKLIKVMLMINYMKDTYPYISGNKNIWEDIRALKKSWGIKQSKKKGAKNG